MNSPRKYLSYDVYSYYYLPLDCPRIYLSYDVYCYYGWNGKKLEFIHKFEIFLWSNRRTEFCSRWIINMNFTNFFIIRKLLKNYLKKICIWIGWSLGNKRYVTLMAGLPGKWNIFDWKWSDFTNFCITLKLFQIF